MSRHSKWSKIKNQKGSADQKKGAIFTKLSRAITVAARAGGDPTSNFKLRLVIDTAKSAAMPKDTIERAIAKGTGADKEGAQIIEETYEGFGPGGVAFMVEIVTDNKNRAYQELRQTFSEHGGNLGSSGSVAWMFEHKGVIRIAAPHLALRPSSPTRGEESPFVPLPTGEGRVREDIELKLIDAGAEDIATEDEGITIYTKPEDLKSVEEKIRASGLTPEYAGLEWVPKEKLTIPEDARAKLENLENALDELEDVSEYYTNATELH
ncbi:hypothetical protein A3F52_05170 [Candidatus Uhrbacteria bacterium RIFCSPHIGHO2_12_FULL_47_11]|nr:MAG: hypothetical protein A2753_00105 [Candidatus Uhrbacteria bacterium RIFCSPHIGHO2_01_FULL_47_11]OGL68187.1 MAG: hypothetical protein A3D58_04210 [Candidatus Uhrbacteria bacterium RIFCSPHIGHO2_02_FULL_46_47]OGL76028.1 MAG: hypothetical protein A3F52_05170 [Candidatus Uhrbacteria bacterium RIFCSPHIGHO2_12_FULL_47_11]OGL83825.1 MAG: hypothetical protein A3J03_02890 [Candidatus Uhrbacteria bacterium RIFCSPLOWO2_02_FULL_46_25]OGL92368.1 MAG: hypothetical protein A3H11_03295 [Candidatus Uhrbact